MDLGASARTNWTSVASSADGSNLVSVAWGSSGGIVNSGVVAVSTNGFGTCFITNFTRTWLSVASSADGRELAAVPNSSRVFLSTNAGASWFSNAAPVADLQRIVSSADGTRLAAGNNVGSIVVSSNSGTTWTLIGSVGGSVTSLATSADGLKLIAVASGAPGPRVFTSTNGGVSWRSNAVPARSDWYACASSADGIRLAALGQKGVIYTSTNAGLGWISNNVPGLVWQAAAFSADGCKLAAVAVNGGIWLLETVPQPQLSLMLPPGQATLSWLVPSANFILQATTNLTAGNWGDVTNLPALNLTNLHNEAVLPPRAAGAFYRLKSP